MSDPDSETQQAPTAALDHGYMWRVRFDAGGVTCYSTGARSRREANELKECIAEEDGVTSAEVVRCA